MSRVVIYSAYGIRRLGNSKLYLHFFFHTTDLKKNKTIFPARFEISWQFWTYRLLLVIRLEISAIRAIFHSTPPLLSYPIIEWPYVPVPDFVSRRPDKSYKARTFVPYFTGSSRIDSVFRLTQQIISTVVENVLWQCRVQITLQQHESFQL